MKRILVVANETVAGKPLIDAVKRHADDDGVQVHVISPQNQPKHGYVVYDEHVRDAAKNRLEITLALLREAGIEANGEVMDPDPYSAVMDALGEQDYDEIIVSTHPETRSGWLRQGLVDRLQRAARRPVEHVVVDLDTERDDVKRTLVVANETVTSPNLLEALKRKAAEEPRRFIVIAPQSAGERRGGCQRAPGSHAEGARGRRAAGHRPGDRPRPLHRHPERAPVLRTRRHRHLDVPRDAFGLAAQRSRRTRSGQHRQAGRARCERGELMDQPRPADVVRTTTARPRRTSRRASRRSSSGCCFSSSPR